MRYFQKITGERIYLSPINTDDAELYTKWLNDSAVTANLGNEASIIGLLSEQRALERMATEGYNFAMVRTEDDALLGNISLMDVDGTSRKATIGLFIGDAENRDRGYGAEAMRLLLDFGFRTLNLHNVMLLVHADNAQAIACYRKVGFREIGRRRDAKYKNGTYIDVVYMDILDSDFYADA